MLIAGCSGGGNKAESPVVAPESGFLAISEVDAIVAEIEPTLAHYPPDVENESDLEPIEEKYDRAKEGIDKLVASDPNNIDLLLKRGHLQRLGHNLDKPGAWEGSESDFKAVLNIDANNVPAMLELGVLYVNTYPEFAPKAQELFERAQEVHGKEPLYDAQRNLFLAIYLQGEFKEAHEHAKYLVKTFPGDETCEGFLRMIEDVMTRKPDND